MSQHYIKSENELLEEREKAIRVLEQGQAYVRAHPEQCECDGLKLVVDWLAGVLLGSLLVGVVWGLWWLVRC